MLMITKRKTIILNITSVLSCVCNKVQVIYLMGGYSVVCIQIFSNNFIAIYFDLMEGAD